MFWLRNKKNNFLLSFLIWGPAYFLIVFLDVKRSGLVDRVLDWGSKGVKGLLV